MATIVEETKNADKHESWNRNGGEVLWMLVHQRTNSKAPLLGLESTEKGDIFKIFKLKVDLLQFILAIIFIG